MDEGDVRFLAQVQADVGEILASNARVEGMKAANAWRAAMGEAQAYPVESFLDEAELIQVIAERLRTS